MLQHIVDSRRRAYDDADCDMLKHNLRVGDMLKHNLRVADMLKREMREMGDNHLFYAS